MLIGRLLTGISNSDKVWDKIFNNFMELKDFILLLARKKVTIFFIVIIFLILAIILSIIQPFKYGSSSQVLVIQNYANPDPYATSKSAEYLSNILAKVIYSNSFFNSVLGSGYFIDKNYFGQTIKDQMKIWNKTVSAKAVNDSGIISLNVYHTDRTQAELINRAVVYTLQTKHNLYHGGGDISIKVIDEPITSNYPVQPNLILNFGLSLVLGLIFSLAFVYLFPEEKYDIKLAGLRLPAQTERSETEFAASVSANGLLKKPEFAPAVEPIEKISPELAAEFNENVNKITNGNFDNYDDLDIRGEDISKQGSMKNIFGKPSADNL